MDGQWLQHVPGGGRYPSGGGRGRGDHQDCPAGQEPGHAQGRKHQPTCGYLTQSWQSINPPLTVANQSTHLTQLPINQSTSHSGHTVACQSIHRTHSCQSINLPHTKLAINQPTSHSCLSSVNQSTAHTVANQLTSHRWQSISPPRTVDTQVPVNQFTAHGGHTVASQSIPLKLWTHSCQSISPTHTVATESIHLAQCTQLLINQSASHSCQTIHLIQLLINQSTSQSCKSINP